MERSRARDILTFIGDQHLSSSIVLDEVTGIEPGDVSPVEIAEALEIGQKACKATDDLLSTLWIAVRVAERDGMPGNPGSAPKWVSGARELIGRIEAGR